MRIVGTPTISAQQLSEDKWKLCVNYKLGFSTEEVNPPHNYTFRHGYRIQEMDDVDHDWVTGWQGFNLNPSAPVVDVTKCIEISSDALDTELGGEEIRAKVLVRNLTTGGNPKMKNSGIIQISPN